MKEIDFYWSLIACYILTVFIYTCTGVTLLGSIISKIHSFFKRIISIPLINILPLLVFLITYIFSVFFFYDNVCSSFLLYNMNKLEAILLIFVFVMPIIALLLLIIMKPGKLDAVKSPQNYCYQDKLYYEYVLFLMKKILENMNNFYFCFLIFLHLN